jgi:outer membrane protein assembly factor BamA
LSPKKLHTGFAILAALIFFACNPARKLPDGQYLLVKNKITIVHKSIDASDLSSYIKQKPNKKQWGTYLRVRIYNLFNKGKTTKTKNWIKNTLGAEPVILDSGLTDNTVKQLRLYLNSKGYFNSSVKREITYLRKKKKARVHYMIDEASPYFINKISYSINDPNLRALIMSDKPHTLLKQGEQYDSDKLSAERDRITTDLNNSGYYYFTPEFIRYQIDSSLKSHQLDIRIDVADPQGPDPTNPDSIITKSHKRYYINKIFVSVDYNTLGGDTIHHDTTKVIIPSRKKGGLSKTYYFVSNGHLKIKPKTITQQIFIDSGEYYRYSDVDKTHKQLLELRIFRYVNIMFNDITKDPAGPGLLDCQVILTRIPIQAFSVEAQVTNRGGDLGVAGSLVYENRNLFRGAEIFNMKLNGALEIEKLSFNTSKADRAIKSIPFFNTVEAGVDFNIKFPKFLMPVNQEKFSKNFKPKTNILAGFNYQQRPNYIRYVTRASFGYEWKESAAKTHLLIPLELNSVVIYPDSAFSVLIDAIPDRIAQNTYKDHIISSIKYSFIYNTQQIGKNENFMYFRGNAEVAGFLFWIYNAIRGHSGSYALWDIPYSQFARLDVDYRYYAFFKGQNSIATRAAFGIGAPLNKANSLPYEKYFYLGGSNSMRGWRTRTLGPGSYNEPDTAKIDNIGDIGLELNFEYRFPIYKYFKGAFFVDAGNTWLRRKDDRYPGGVFKFDRFYSELAFDAGLGLRLDFGFFLIRVDGAIPLKNPSLAPGDRWVFQNNNKIKIIGNLGIGYPF